MHELGWPIGFGCMTVIFICENLQAASALSRILKPVLTSV